MELSELEINHKNEFHKKYILSKMTLEEKIKIVTGSSFWNTYGIERLNIPKLRMTDGPHGIRDTNSDDNLGVTNSNIATCFPTGICMGATWDPGLIKEIGEALGTQALLKGNDILLGPCINIHRTPLGGRNFESFGEDPYLAGIIATSYINGVQSTGVAACIKHFAVNNQEYHRTKISVEIDERALHEIYFSAFEMAIKESDPWAIMSAYNKINGEYCSQNKYLLKEILRDLWKYDGVVISDWGAVHDQVKSIKSGNDLRMPYNDSYDEIMRSIKNGDLSECDLDNCVSNILKLVLKIKTSDKISHKNIKNENEFEFADMHAELAYDAAVSGMVLLKNHDETFPLKPETSIAVMGPNACCPVYQGFGSSKVNPPYVISPLDGIISEFGSENVNNYDYICNDSKTKSIIQAAEVSEIALLFMGPTLGTETESDDRTSMRLDRHQEEFILETSKYFHEKNRRVGVILNNGAPIEMGYWINHVDVVLEAWLPGQECGKAIAKIISGANNPCGKLPMTFPKTFKQHPSYMNYPGHKDKVYYGEGIYVGYRYFDTFQINPEFPFGHGLSYTNFEYSNLIIKNKTFNSDISKVENSLKIQFDIKNTGEIKGAEVAQMYIRDTKSSIQRPDKELKDFKKISLEPGRASTVEFEINFRKLAHYDAELGKWVVQPGEFEILVGASSSDIRLRDSIFAVGDDPYGYGLKTDLRTLLQNSSTELILIRHFTKEIFEKDSMVYFRAETLGTFINEYCKWFDIETVKKEKLLEDIKKELKSIPLT